VLSYTPGSEACRARKGVDTKGVNERAGGLSRACAQEKNVEKAGIDGRELAHVRAGRRAVRRMTYRAGLPSEKLEKNTKGNEWGGEEIAFKL